MLELSEWELGTTRTNKSKSINEKKKTMCARRYGQCKLRDGSAKNQKEMLEIKNTVTEMWEVDSQLEIHFSCTFGQVCSLPKQQIRVVLEYSKKHDW